MSRAGGVVALVAWIAFLAAMSTWSNTDFALAGAALGTVVFGLAVGHFAVVLVPLVGGIAVAVATLLAGDNPDDAHGTSASAWALYLLGWALAFTLLVALGVGLRQVVRGVRRR